MMCHYFLSFLIKNLNCRIRHLFEYFLYFGQMLRGKRKFFSTNGDFYDSLINNDHILYCIHIDIADVRIAP